MLIKKIKNRIELLYNGFYNRKILNQNNVIYGQTPNIRGRLYIKNDYNNQITIGSNVTINSSVSSNPIGGDGRMVMWLLQNGCITIGSNVGISNSTFVSDCGIIIDNDVYIGGGCKIYDTDFHSVNYLERVVKHDINTKKAAVHIKEGAFIGAFSIILKGVTVGEKAVIGAGSVVTRNVPDNEVWAGNPATFIKKVKNETK